MINDLLQYVYEQGWSNALYNGVLVLAYIVHFLFLIFYRKKYDISFKKTVITLAIVYPAVYYLMLLLTWIENGFQNWGANNIIRVYIYVPLIALAVSKIIKIPFGKMADFIAPSMALQQAVCHTVCPFVGCCNGFPFKYGIWSPLTDELLFPIQWLECLVAAIVFVFLQYYAKKNNYCGNGMVYAMFLITFGGTRFFLEFLRDNEKLFVGMSSLAMHALFMVVVGTIWFMVNEEIKNQKQKRKIYH